MTTSNPNQRSRPSIRVIVALVCLSATTGCGARQSHQVSAGQATTVPHESSAPISSAIAPPTDAVTRAMDEFTMLRTAVAKNCGQPKSKVGEPPVAPDPSKQDPRAQVRVGFGPHCEKGLADPSINSVDPPPVSPVFDLDGTNKVVGYWGDGIGWITIEQHDRPGFEPKVLREAATRVLTDPGGSQDPASETANPD